MKKKINPTISIALDPELIQKLEEGKYNRSKLIDSLLTEYFKRVDKSVKEKPTSPPSRSLKEGENVVPPKK